MRDKQVILAFMFVCALPHCSPALAGPQGQKEGDHHWEVPPYAWEMQPLTPALARRGNRLYGRFCIACHGAEGDGRRWLAGNLAKLPPDLARSATEHAPGELAWKIATGRGLMPGWKTVLTVSELWAVAARIESFSSSGGPQEHGKT